MKEGNSHWIDATFGYYVELFRKIDEVPANEPVERRRAFAAAWTELIKQDHFSTRGYMLAGPTGKPTGAPDAFPGPVVEWIETFGSATGLYDLAFSESIMVSWSLRSYL